MADSNDLRLMNRRRIALATLYAPAGLSRSALARETGLSQPTAGRIVDELLAERVLVAADDAPQAAAAKRLGRPGQGLRLDADRGRFLAVQLGVANTRVAPLPVAPPTVDVWAAEFATPGTLRAWLAAIVRRAEPIRRAAPDLAAAIVCLPGVVDESTGRCLLSPNLPWLTPDVDVRRELQSAIGLPVHVVQEIRCLAMGHAIVATPEDVTPGTGPRDAGDFLLVDFGAGVGAAAILGGQTYNGPSPWSGEIGHLGVPGNRRPCGCGGRGCLETLASRRAITDAVLGRSAGDRDWPAVMRRVARDGINDAFAATLDAVADALAAAATMLGIGRIVVTGSLAELSPPAVAHVAARVNGNVLLDRFGGVRIVAAPRRRLAGLAAVALDRLIVPAA